MQYFLNNKNKLGSLAELNYYKWFEKGFLGFVANVKASNATYFHLNFDWNY